jgi:hypothetical protein
MLSARSQMEQMKEAVYSRVQQEEILDLTHYTLTKLFEGKTLSELRSDADRLGLRSAERVNITLRHCGRIRGSWSWPGDNLGRQIVESVFRAAMDRRYGAHLANPMRCKGGVAFGLTDRRVRCDSVQHFITLCLATEQVKDGLL